MARYFFALHEHDRSSEDDEGAVFGSLAAVRDEARRAAREIMCAQLAEGRLNLKGHIDVKDRTGAIVASISFKEAVAVTGLEAEKPIDQ